MIGTRREHPHGTVTNIFNFECASLAVMRIGHGNEQQQLTVLRVGELVVNLYAQAMTHIKMTTCSVRDMQWPLPKDSMVIRVGERSFAFVMLGLLYCLQLPPVCDEEMVNTLERVFMKFSDYTGLNNGANGYPCVDHEPTFWSTVRPFAENIARAKLGNNWRPTEGNEVTSLLKVVRTSAATKIVSNAILAGFLKPVHVEIFFLKKEDQMKRESDSEDAFPSISAITDIVNSFGAARETPAGDPRALPEDAQEDDNPETALRIKLWKLNQLGIVLFSVKNQNLFVSGD